MRGSAEARICPVDLLTQHPTFLRAAASPLTKATLVFDVIKYESYIERGLGYSQVKNSGITLTLDLYSFFTRSHWRSRS